MKSIDAIAYVAIAIVLAAALFGALGAPVEMLPHPETAQRAVPEAPAVAAANQDMMFGILLGVGAILIGGIMVGKGNGKVFAIVIGFGLFLLLIVAPGK